MKKKFFRLMILSTLVLAFVCGCGTNVKEYFAEVQEVGIFKTAVYGENVPFVKFIPFLENVCLTVPVSNPNAKLNDLIGKLEGGDKIQVKIEGKWLGGFKLYNISSIITAKGKYP